MDKDKKKHCHSLKVLRKIQETDDTCSLVLEIPQDKQSLFNYKAGQFVTFFLDINNEEIRRSYSLASSPDLDSDFKVTVKRVPNGKGSNYLMDQIQVGSTLWTTPPAGLFILPADLNQKSLAFYAAGSGITPIISMIKYALHAGKSSRCSLLFQNKSEDSIIFREELTQLQKKYPDRFVVEHVLSQPPPQWTGPTGRSEKSHIRNFLTKNLIDIRAIHFMCGPEGFMSIVERALLDLNVPAQQIRKESFLSPTELKIEQKDSVSDTESVGAGATFIGDKSSQSAPEILRARFDSTDIEIQIDPKKTVLENLLEAGHNPPYSCLDGACMACMARVEEGLVYQNDLGILTDDNVDAKECLTCQARPISKVIKINYDTF